MLTPAVHVPHVLAGEVQGLDGTRCWPVLPQPRDRLTLWAVGADMTAVHLDLAGLDALIAALNEVRAAMVAAPG